jgi:hypothetical protein
MGKGQEPLKGLRCRAAIERRSGELDSSSQGRYGVSSVESGSSVEQHNIASRTRDTSEHGANDIGRLLRVCDLEVRKATRGKPELLRTYCEPTYSASAPLRHQSRAYEGDFIESVLAVYGQGMRTTQSAQGFGQGDNPTLVKYADQLVARTGWVRQWSQEIEDCADTDLTARADGMAHGSVKRRSKQKTEPDLAQAILYVRWGQFDSSAKSLQYISTAYCARHRTVAVLSHTETCGGGDQGCSSRNVKSVASIPSCPTGVEHRANGLHRCGECTHHSGCTGNLSYGLSFDVECSQKRADLGRSYLTIHDLSHDCRHFIVNEVAACGHTGDSLLHRHGILFQDRISLGEFPLAPETGDDGLSFLFVREFTHSDPIPRFSLSLDPADHWGETLFA